MILLTFLKFIRHHGHLNRRYTNNTSCAASQHDVGMSLVAGFTLIELMVVLLIMGVLMAIAIPTFLGVTGSAKDKAAQSDLTNALIAAKTYYTSTQNYSPYGTDPSWLQSEMHSIKIVPYYGPANASQNQVAAYAGFPNYTGVINMYSYSSTGICWFISDNENEFNSGAWNAPPGVAYALVQDSGAKYDCDQARWNNSSTWSGWKKRWPTAPAGM